MMWQLSAKLSNISILTALGQHKSLIAYWPLAHLIFHKGTDIGWMMMILMSLLNLIFIGFELMKKYSQ